MILVDSSVWINYLKGTITARTEKLDALLGKEPLAIGDLILTEVLQAFADRRPQRSQAVLHLSMYHVESVRIGPTVYQ